MSSQPPLNTHKCKRCTMRWPGELRWSTIEAVVASGSCRRRMTLFVPDWRAERVAIGLKWDVTPMEGHHGAFSGWPSCCPRLDEAILASSLVFLPLEIQSLIPSDHTSIELLSLTLDPQNGKKFGQYQRSRPEREHRTSFTPERVPPLFRGWIRCSQVRPKLGRPSMRCRADHWP